MVEREPAAQQGDAVEARTDAQARELLGETGALPEQSAEEDPAALRAEIGDLQAEVERLRADLAAAQQRADDERTARARAQADHENFRRRMLAEQARWQDDARKGLIEDLLAPADNLERAKQASGDVESLKKGVELTLRQLFEAFRRSGLEDLEVAPGTPFDPNLHEAVASVPSPDHVDGAVVTVERRGYTFKGTLLRPALVTVAKGPSGRDTQA
jgi:molecular chaperone GrpE